MGRDIPCVILAGGQGRRLGGNKAFVPLAGRPLIGHVIARLAPQCGVLAVNTPLTEADLTAKGIGLTAIADADVVRGMGPLAGIWAAMDWAARSGADRVLTAPVDTPFLPSDLADRLAGAEARIALAETADGMHGTCGLWSVDLRDELHAALLAGQRKVTDFTARHGAVGVRFADMQPPPFFNVNRPEDLAQAESWMA